MDSNKLLKLDTMEVWEEEKGCIWRKAIVVIIKILQFISNSKKKVRICTINLIFKQILLYMCEFYNLILVLLNLTIQVICIGGNSNI